MSLLGRLFGHLTATADPKPDDLVVAGVPDGEAVGELWVSMLKDQGLFAQMRDVSPLYRGYMNWAGEYEVRVRYADLARAREILGLDDNGVVRARRSRRRTEKR